ncbi:energy transducer TonB [Prolixibacteraceae bacterium JC049]|nr:energy transducer TonB [Prolixibacteraceae bacterium JC049]
MKPKKTPKADLERKRGLFFQIGLILALGIVFGAMRFTQDVSNAIDLGPVEFTEEIEDQAPITKHEEIKPPPPPPTVNLDNILVVDDDTEIDEELEIEDSEIDENEAIEAAVNLDQGEEEVDDTPLPFAVLEDKPVFPGGERGLMKYIHDHVQYPVIAQENGIQGVVYVAFVIDERGKVTEVKALRGPDIALNKEAVRVVKSLPKWKPGKQRGKPVRVSFHVPINFKLQ